MKRHLGDREESKEGEEKRERGMEGEIHFHLLVCSRETLLSAGLLPKAHKNRGWEIVGEKRIENSIQVLHVDGRDLTA